MPATALAAGLVIVGGEFARAFEEHVAQAVHGMVETWIRADTARLFDRVRGAFECRQKRVQSFESCVHVCALADGAAHGP